MGHETPEKIGAGWWSFLRQAALSGDIHFFQRAIVFTSLNFPCPTCRQHFQQFLSVNAVSMYTDQNIDGRSPARFVWLAQNNANHLVGKREMSWEDFKKTYVPNLKPTEPPCVNCAINPGTGQRHQQSAYQQQPAPTYTTPYGSVTIRRR